MSSSIKLTNSSGKIVTITNPDTTSADVAVDLLNNAYTIATVNDFGTVPVGYTTAIVKDIDRGGTFIWSSTGTANDGTVFAGATGYWNRQYSGVVNVKWFGAKGDGVTDDTSAIQSAISNHKSVFIQNGTYLITSTIYVNSAYHNNIIGESRNKTKIIRNGDFISLSVGSTGDLSRINISNLYFNVHGSNPAVLLNAFRNSKIDNIQIEFDVLPTVVSEQSIGIKITSSWSSFINNIYTILGSEFRAEPTQSSIGIYYGDDVSGIVTNDCIMQDVKDAFYIASTSGSSIGYRFTNCTHEGGSAYTSSARTFVVIPPATGIQGIFIDNFKCEIVDKFVEIIDTYGGHIYGLFVKNSYFKGHNRSETYNLKRVTGMSLFDTNMITQYSNSIPALFDSNCRPYSTASALTVGAANVQRVRVLEALYNDANNVLLNGTIGTWNNLVVPLTALGIGQESARTPSVVAIFIRYFRSSTPTTLKFQLSSNTSSVLDVSGNYGQGASYLYVPITNVYGDLGYLQYYSSNTSCKVYQIDIYYTN